MPFEYFVLNQQKDFYLCCEGWLHKPVGNFKFNSATKAWNNEIAREIRRSILDGSFRYCNSCPFLDEKKVPVQQVDKITDERLKNIIKNQTTVLDKGPQCLNLAHDCSCNLMCPSCRTGIIQTKKTNHEEYEENKRIAERILGELKDCLEWLYVSGSGDPFGSKLYHEILMSLKQENFPHMKLYLHSNGQLFDQKNWDSIRAINQSVKRVQISIDAANGNTYRKNRGSSWKRLNRNLKFISRLRQNGPVENFDISMVVQQNNWGEMLQFIDLGRKYGADNIIFLALQNWGTFSEQEYSLKAVHLESHPEHRNLVRFLSGAAVPGDIEVYWGPFARYVKGGLISA
jgi:MoaA/NifB/PqqE/SkfB family radical SAM enzyme